MPTANELPHSPSKVVATWMVTAGLGNTPATGGTQPSWPIYDDNKPPAPDAAIVITDTQGILSPRDAFGGQFERYGIQVLIRAGTKPVAWRKANLVAEALRQKTTTVTVTINDAVGNHQYCLGLIRKTSGPLRLGNEQGNTRREYTINALVDVKLIS